ncbi:hypothetical protein EJ08DRAFT_243478 [Tothia fuscella]|uniref:Uncharacterized protein n=1 Tax=Tothia fuscella TaxID=1048955 RepID=A0A9P4TYB9_9PEZI|nr:hypothetical protein EJ08DRAFT_243478 [Tothia fuscella]
MTRWDNEALLVYMLVTQPFITRQDKQVMIDNWPRGRVKAPTTSALEQQLKNLKKRLIKANIIENFDFAKCKKERSLIAPATAGRKAPKSKVASLSSTGKPTSNQKLKVELEISSDVDEKGDSCTSDSDDDGETIGRHLQERMRVGSNTFFGGSHAPKATKEHHIQASKTTKVFPAKDKPSAPEQLATAQSKPKQHKRIAQDDSGDDGEEPLIKRRKPALPFEEGSDEEANRGDDAILNRCIAQDKPLTNPKKRDCPVIKSEQQISQAQGYDGTFNQWSKITQWPDLAAPATSSTQPTSLLEKHGYPSNTNERPSKEVMHTETAEQSNLAHQRISACSTSTSSVLINSNQNLEKSHPSKGTDLNRVCPSTDNGAPMRVRMFNSAKGPTPSVKPTGPSKDIENPQQHQPFIQQDSVVENAVSGTPNSLKQLSTLARNPCGAVMKDGNRK